MSKLMRTALGTAHRYSMALEELEGGSEVEIGTVVMKGPLANVYAAALGEVYDKENPPVEGGDPAALPEPGAETGTNLPEGEPAPEPGDPLAGDPADAPLPEGGDAPVDGAPPAEGGEPGAGEPTGDGAAPSDAPAEEPAGEEPTADDLNEEEKEALPEVTEMVLESQAIDATLISALAAGATVNAPKNEVDYQTLYAIDQTQVDQASVVEVTKILAESDNPENVSILIDDVLPENTVTPPSEEEVAQTEKLAAAMESIAIAHGAKVYRKFNDYVSARRMK